MTQTCLNDKYCGHYTKWFKKLTERWNHILPEAAPKEDYIWKYVDTKDIQYVKFNLENTTKIVPNTNPNYLRNCYEIEIKNQQARIPDYQLGDEYTNAITNIRQCLGFW